MDLNLMVKGLGKTKKMPKYEKNGKFSDLPADITRLLASYANDRDIIRLCRLNKKIDNDLYRNDRFLASLAHKRLTVIDKRVVGKNIIKELHCTRILKVAVISGYLEKVKYIVARDRYADVKDISLLKLAISTGHLDIVQYLASMGTDLHFQNDLAFKMAVRRGHLDIAKYLVSQGSIVNHVFLMGQAVQYGRLDMMKYLISLGVDYHPDYLLEQAAHYGHLDIVEYLLYPTQPNVAKADIHTNQDVPLFLASRYGYLNIVKYLIEHGANVRARNDDAVVTALVYGHLEVAKYLVSQGSNIHVWSHNNTLLSMTVKNSAEIANYLRSFGISVQFCEDLF